MDHRAAFNIWGAMKKEIYSSSMLCGGNGFKATRELFYDLFLNVSPSAMAETADAEEEGAQEQAGNTEG